MTDVNPVTSASAAAAKEAKAEMRADDALERMTGECDTIEDLLKDMCGQFNMMRSELATFVNLCRGFGSTSPRFAETLKAVSHGDYGDLLKRYGCVDRKAFTSNVNGCVDDVERAGGFASAVERIMQTNIPTTRMLACIEVNERIAAAIDSWQSKIDKMKTRSASDGSSEAEMAAAGKLLVKFSIAVETLKKRGSQISEIYFDADKQLSRFRADCKEKFNVIFFNQKATPRKDKE